MKPNLSISNSKRSVFGLMAAGITITVKTVCFLLAFVLLFQLATELLAPKNDTLARWQAIYALPEDSVDLLFIGNSHSYCAFDPKVFQKELGVSAFVSATSSEVLPQTYFHLKEVLKRQSPKIVVLEAFTFQKSVARNAFLDSNFDGMKLGLNKIDAAITLFKDPKDRKELLFGIYRNHINWKNSGLLIHNVKRLLKKNEVPSSVEANRGFYPLYSTMSEETIEKYGTQTPPKIRVTTRGEIPEYFNKIADLCKQEGIRLVLVMAPMSYEYISRVDYAQASRDIDKLASSRNVEYVDFNFMHEELGLTSSDFADEFSGAQHINKYGARKVSMYLAEYLEKRFPDAFK